MRRLRILKRPRNSASRHRQRRSEREKDQQDSESAKTLARQHEKALSVSDDEYRKAFSEGQRGQWDSIKDELEGIHDLDFFGAVPKDD